ncbi:hypothetical protein [Enterovirga aerilata]|uniref:Uncharacterized protein n=1 Tax=Enterovirga aerilata TaxID=2730920 RepID=A0A849I381_9HYPH|nr:hypothetical protein [Enterovirga sp. DB1703]NNM71801.1 hypothetical protein [Enterovirga sp. DB1703]
MLGGEEGGRRSVLLWTVKTAAAIAFLSFLASNWLAGPALDNGTLARLAAITAGGAADPTTTGSILRGGSATKLDPCAVPRRP